MEPQYGWHTLAWILVSLFAGVLFFRLGGFGVDRHENLPDEDTPLLTGCFNWATRSVSGLVLVIAVLAALFGWSFMGWIARV